MSTEPTFSADVERFEDHVLIRLRGELDLLTGEELAALLAPELGAGIRVVVDLADLDFMDSSGLAVLLVARTEHAEKGGELEMRNPSAAVRRLFEVTGLHGLFDGDESPSAE